MERHRGDRDRDRDRDTDRDRDRYGNNPDSRPYRRPSRFSDGAPPLNNHRRNPVNFRAGFSGSVGGGHHPFDSPPSQPPGVGGGSFRPVGAGAGGGFRPMSGGGGGAAYGSSFQPPFSGQKRGFPFSGRGGSPDRYDGSNFAKLFVGSVPRTATEEEIRPLFEQHGNVIEVALIKDKRTGQQQGTLWG